MNIELKRFFNKINFAFQEEDFLQAEINKVTINKNKETMSVYIVNERPISYKIMSNLFLCAQTGIKDINKLKINIKYNQINDDNILIYFKAILEDYLINRPSLVSLEDNEIFVQDNVITMEVNSKVEKNLLLEESESLIKEMTNYGFPKLILEVKTNKKKKAEIKEDIALDKQKTIVVPKKELPESNILYGKTITREIIDINSINSAIDNVAVEAYVFGINTKETEKIDIITLKISDKSSSIIAKFRLYKNNHQVYEELVGRIKEKEWYRIEGKVEVDPFERDIVLYVKSMEKIASKDLLIIDEEEEKRVELHAHTFMSQMDGLVSVTDLIKQARKFGHKAIAITDHNCIQSFPDAFNDKNNKGEDKVKIIYGAELNVINDDVDIVINKKNYNLLEDEYVVFDTETTGFNAAGGDQLIEIGAVVIKNGVIGERFDYLIDPKRPLPAKITELTHITDDMLKGQPSEEEIVKKFLSFVGKRPLVAHNARFDYSFINIAMEKYHLGELTNTIVDTMEFSRILNPEQSRHNLSAIVKRYKINFDEEGHHRADYDAEATAVAFYKMSKILYDRNIETIDDLYLNTDQTELLKFSRPFHVTVLVKNQIGLKNLFKIISLANTKYLYKIPKIPRSQIIKYREGLLFGSGCVNGEIFNDAKSKSDEELTNAMAFYDFVEVNPPSVCSHLLDTGEFSSASELLNHIEKIINVAEAAGKMVCATGDVHHLTKDDKICREIIINQKTPNVGFHPLYRPGVIKVPSMHYMTTKEMLEEFNFLNPEESKKIVVTNPVKIVDLIEEVQIIKDKLYTPKMNNSAEETKKMVYDNAFKMYGDPLPLEVAERIEKELHGIINGGYDVIYLIAQKLVKKSNEDGYFVGSRGSVGSSFVATMMGITEVNPLPAHYLCPKCKKTIFDNEQGPLNMRYASGYDLPDRTCECGTLMKKEGQDMPFATFLGFNADKVPDIDLNFSGENQADAHNYTKVLFGEDKVFRAGTIGTVADKTAFGFTKGYCEDNNITLRNIEIERLAMGCIGVKRTTGQHPGGIIVIPENMDIYDFSPFQYPADDPNNSWYTTHLDFHAIHDNVLKLDILGHDDPTMLKYLGDITAKNIMEIPFDDQKVLSLFSSCKALGVTKEQINCSTGSLGLPEFGTQFVIKMLEETKPKTFAELVKISGLSHGTDVWQGNASELIKNKVVDFKDIIGCRDDIMVNLINYGMEPSLSFKISEFVRKGMASKDHASWLNYAKTMKEQKIPDWFITSCSKIKYMFPKAHATAYVMMGYRVAWFKLYMPLVYYACFFGIRAGDFDIEAMIKGREAILKSMANIQSKGYDATNKEKNILETLSLALEMVARGFKFATIELNRSQARMLTIDEENKALILPFSAIEGLGEQAAKKIINERNERPFLSIEDFQNRCRISSTTMDKLKTLGVFQGMVESNQLSLF